MNKYEAIENGEVRPLFLQRAKVKRIIISLYKDLFLAYYFNSHSSENCIFFHYFNKNFYTCTKFICHEKNL